MSFYLKKKPIRIDRISQVFKPGKHRGIDLVDTRGTKAPVYATADGTVSAAKKGAWDWSYGNMVAIYHGNKTYTNHAHLSRICVKQGQKVKAGDIIGYQGSTGRSTGNHLHFEIHLNGKWNRVDPEPYINAIGKKAKVVYEIGKVYRLTEDMNIRKTPAGDIQPVSKWTANAKKNKTDDGLLTAGTGVTCKALVRLESGAVWMQTPSGWVCAIGTTGKIYIK